MLQAAQAAVRNAFELFVVEAGHVQYGWYFCERLEGIEQAITAVTEGLAKAPHRRGRSDLQV